MGTLSAQVNLKFIFFDGGIVSAWLLLLSLLRLASEAQYPPSEEPAAKQGRRDASPTFSVALRPGNRAADSRPFRRPLALPNGDERESRLGGTSRMQDERQEGCGERRYCKSSGNGNDSVIS